MPRTIIIPDVQQLTDHYLRQQRGGNIAGFRGTRMQRGYGIGGIFRSLARFAMPLFKKSAESVGKRALKAATEVGKDVLDGKSFKESTKSRGREVFKDLANQGANALLHQAGRGKKRRLGEHSNLSCIKRRKLLYDPADQQLYFVKRFEKLMYFLKPEFVYVLSTKLRDTMLPATPDIPNARAIQCTNLITF